MEKNSNLSKEYSVDVSIKLDPELKFARQITALKTKSITMIAVLAVSLNIGSPVWSLESNKQKVIAIEKVLFFKTYDAEKIEKRLERLEKRYFGEPNTGSIDERVDKIYAIAKPQIEASQRTEEPGISDESQPDLKNNPQYPTHKTEFEDPDKKLEEKKLAVLQARQEEISALLKEGISFWKSRDGDHAMDRFEQVVRLDPRNEEAYFSLGVIYEARGELNKALASYNKANYINPERMDYKEAILVVQKAIKKKSAGGDLASRALEAFKRKEYLSALDLYKQLETTYPDNAKYKYNIGTIYLLIKSPEQALNYYKKACKLDPKQAKYKAAFDKLSKTLKQSNDKQKSVETAWEKQTQMKKQLAQNRNQVAPNRPNNSPQSPGQYQGQMPGQPGPGYNQRPAPGQYQGQMPGQVNQNPIGQPPQQGTTQTPYTGPTPPLTKQVLAAMGLIIDATPHGITVNTVGIGSRAAKAGVKVGDIVISVNGVNIKSTTQLALLLSKIPNGQKGQLLLKRSGQVGQVMF